MKNLLIAMLMLGLTHAATAGLWTDDYEAALARAKTENRFLLLDFTGSDWCGWCKRLDAEVFSKSAFKQYASEKLVCVTVDFPRGFALKRKTQEQNKTLARKFDIQGYPTIVLLNPDGTTLATTGYQQGGAEAYVQHLESFIAPAREKLGISKEEKAAPPANGSP